MPLPDAIKNKPRLLPGLNFIQNAFWSLSTDRAIGMAEGPIPWTAVNSYALRHDIWGYEFDRFYTLIRAMDEVYIEHKNIEHKKNTLKASKNKQSFNTNIKK